MTSITLPGLPPLPNVRRSTRERIGTARRWREPTALLLRDARVTLPTPLWQPEAVGVRVSVTLTRRRTRGPEADFDGLVASFKPVRDAVAGELFRRCPCCPGRVGRHDGDPRIAWHYAQARGPEACVTVGIEWGGAR